MKRRVLSPEEKQDELLGMIAFVDHNVQGLRDMGWGPAWRVVNHYLNRDKREPRFILQRVLHSAHRDEFIRIMVEKFRNTRSWFKFVDAIMSVSDQFLANRMNASRLDNLFADEHTLAYLLTNHRERLLKVPGSFFYGFCAEVSSDRYWREELKQYIEPGKRQYRRAWHVLHLAVRGIPTWEDPLERWYGASGTGSERLLGLLYDAMAEDKLIQPGDLADIHARGFRAGMALAPWFSKERRDRLLIVANYFAKERNQRRAQKRLEDRRPTVQ